MNQNTGRGDRKRLSVAVVGGGFGGVGAAVMLGQAGFRDVTVFERAERVGGVWHHNTYPGAACDVPSHLYEFSFAPNPDWSRRYAPQEEIREYIEAIVDRFGVRDRIRTGVEVQSAAWDEQRELWVLRTSAGEHEANVLITACGQLSRPRVAAIPGADRFAGPAFHTARWRHDTDLRGKRVAVIGTGASAIQLVPALQPVAAHIDVYQRSPGWTLPKMDFAYRERTKRLFARFPVLQRLDRALLLAFMDLGAAGMTRHRWMLAPFRAAGRRQIKAAIADQGLRRRVTPADEVGCKRIMLTDTWYPALAEPNVDLIDDPIAEITPGGVRTADGAERPADVIVWATGFHSHDFTAPMEITGSGGRTLTEAWGGRARAYLGLSVPDFPNMFLLYGPNTNGGTGSVIETLECGIRHVIAALGELEARGERRIEVDGTAAARFDSDLRTALAQTVWHSGCTSWYVDENGHDPSQWPYLWRTYARRTRVLEPGAYAIGKPALSRDRTAA